MSCYRLTTQFLVLVLVSNAAGDKHASQLHLNDDSSDSQRYYSSYNQPQERDDRKLVYVNNNAYDLSEEEQTRVWELYLKKGYVPDTEDLDSTLQKDPLMATVMSPVAVGEEGSKKAFGILPDNQFSSRIDSQQYLVKSSRFVADPDKVHLIEEVNSEELQDFHPSSTTTEASKRVGTESSVDVSTVHYEATKVNALTFIWQEMWNIGELLGREVFNITDRLWYLLNSLLKYVQGRRRRGIPDLSKEL
ncbi:hypothetical protein Pmani_009510 [Petrolisthes manimaculis]|uniref:Uncharacterized protein n=1 Tax=Petrolisthes manimaculis TaxID=1843537 RepID=A0AAE1Q4T2_9EUCA|nr:hypothetical protein Pmani_009510 [Petrolisthes manimaculis]